MNYSVGVKNKYMANKRSGNRHVSRAVLLAAAGLTAGYYFYASENAKKNRKIAAKWAGDLKHKVVTEAKKHGTLDKKTVANIVDAATKTYAKVSKMDSKKLAAAAGEWIEVPPPGAAGPLHSRLRLPRSAVDRGNRRRTAR